jgi:nitrite reductase/ring-hydroxylating ferredoxin subunit
MTPLKLLATAILIVSAKVMFDSIRSKRNTNFFITNKIILKMNIKSQFIPLINQQELYNGFKKNFTVNGNNFLLIQENNNIYLLENKCGHFGVRLDDANIEEASKKNVIICKQHGISFDLSTGEVINRPWENCDPIKIMTFTIKNNILGFIES